MRRNASRNFRSVVRRVVQPVAQGGPEVKGVTQSGRPHRPAEVDKLVEPRETLPLKLSARYRFDKAGRHGPRTNVEEAPEEFVLIFAGRDILQRQ